VAKRGASTHPRAAGRGTSHTNAAAPARGSAAADGSCADAGLTPTDQNLERVRAATLCLVNRERASHGIGPLRLNPRLLQAAQSHTESMAFGNYFEHVGPHGDTPLDRIRAAGYIYSSRLGYEVGENLGFGTLWPGTAPTSSTGASATPPSASPRTRPARWPMARRAASTHRTSASSPAEAPRERRSGPEIAAGHI
jgi:hypothetical protein